MRYVLSRSFCSENNREMKFTWVHVLCLVVVGASAQSFDSGFRLNVFHNVNGRCDNGFGVQAPVMETSRIGIPNFIAPAIAQQSCDCVRAIGRPQIKNEIITIPSVQRFFQTPSSPIIQAIPIVNTRNIHIPAFPLPSLKIYTEVTPSQIVDTRNRIFSATAVNIGSSTARPVCSLGGNFQGIVKGAFLGNSLGAAPELVSSFPRTIGAGFNARGNGVILPRSSVVAGGFTNEELRNFC